MWSSSHDDLCRCSETENEIRKLKFVFESVAGVSLVLLILIFVLVESLDGLDKDQTELLFIVFQAKRYKDIGHSVMTRIDIVGVVVQYFDAVDRKKRSRRLGCQHEGGTTLSMIVAGIAALQLFIYHHYREPDSAKVQPLEIVQALEEFAAKSLMSLDLTAFWYDIEIEGG